MSETAAKTLKVAKQLYREALISFDGEGELRSARVSISSDTPYLREDWDGDQYWEVLDHSPGAMDESRLKAGLPMLFNHQRGFMLGRASSYANTGSKIYVDGIMWSEDPAAQLKKKDFDNGVLIDTSVGYSLLDDGTCVGEQDGIPVYKFKCEIHEFSLVTIAADITVGAGRSKEDDGEPKIISIKSEKEIDLSSKPPKTKTMPEATESPETKINVEQERQSGADAYKASAKKIREWVKTATTNHPDWLAPLQVVAERHLEGNADFNSFLAEAVPAIPGAKSVSTPHEESKIGMSKGDRKHFSLAKAILESHTGGLTGIEKDACEAAAKQYAGKDSRSFSGLCIPDDILTARFDEDHDLNSNAIRALAMEVGRIGRSQNRSLNASVFTAGGALVATELLGGSLIDILRNAVLIGQGPMAITELGGLVGNIAIPKQTGTSTVYWLSEGAAVTESQQTFAQLNMSPHRMSVATSYTKQLLAQASISVEMFVRSDQAQAMAVEEDRVTLLGTGLNGEPLGIFNTSGILANVTFGGAAVWADMIALEYGLENANVRSGMMAILTSPLSKSYLKQTLVAANSTFPIFIWGKNDGYPDINGVKPGVVNDYPAYATKNVTTNQMVQGVFQNVIKARWAGFDVVVDPYTGAASETIKVYVNQWLDVGLRYPQSFNVTTDAPSAP